MGCIHFPDLPDEISNCMLCKPKAQVVGTRQATTSSAPGVFRRHGGPQRRVDADGWMHARCADARDPRAVEAMFPGRCVECDEYIDEGDMIVPNAPLDAR